MTFEEYQQRSRVTALYPDAGNNFVYPTLGLVGEAGETADKIKKVIRDNAGVMTDEVKIEIGKELGDVLWYIAQQNLEKLLSRKARGVISGSGDNR